MKQAAVRVEAESCGRPAPCPRCVRLLLATLALTAVLQGCLLRPATALPGARLSRGTNAAWLGIEWVNERHENSEIAALAQDLARRQIRYIYVFASYLRPDGALNPTYVHAVEFTHALKAVQPALNVQAWIGLPLAQSSLPGGEQHGVTLDDAAVRERIVAFAVELVRQHGFDGIHLDAEPVADGDPAVLALLDEMRNSLGPEPTLSIATRRIWPLSLRMPSAAGRLFWSAGYYQKVASRVDQVALMTYDSALPLPQLYRVWGHLEVVAITHALERTDVDLFVGIPTSEERTWTHWPGAENMASGLHGLVDGLNDARAVPDALTGVAIYPYWETNAGEWATYDSLWLGR